MKKIKLLLSALTVLLFIGVLSTDLRILTETDEESSIELISNLAFAQILADEDGTNWACSSQNDNSGNCIAVVHPTDNGTFCGGGCGVTMVVPWWPYVYTNCNCSGTVQI